MIKVDQKTKLTETLLLDELPKAALEVETAHGDLGRDIKHERKTPFDWGETFLFIR